MSVAKRDYYEVLSVSRDCDEQTLKGSYRKLAMRYHPDRNPGDRDAEEKFKEAAEAYAILSDGQKRSAYDRFGIRVSAAWAATARQGSMSRSLLISGTYWATCSDLEISSAAEAADAVADNASRSVAKIFATIWRLPLKTR